MRKHVFGRQFKRDVNERKALFKSLLSELVMHERIQTTEEKAKSVKADADRLITKAKKTDRLHAYTLLQPLVTADAVKKLMSDLGPRFSQRNGGYTRIIRLQRRFNDNAKMAFIEWTEAKSEESGTISKNNNKEMIKANLTLPTKTAKAKKTVTTKTTKAVKEPQKAKKVTTKSKKEDSK